MVWLSLLKWPRFLFFVPIFDGYLIKSITDYIKYNKLYLKNKMIIDKSFMLCYVMEICFVSCWGQLCYSVINEYQ